MMTPAQAALKAGVSRTTIMNSIKSGDLHAVRDNRNRWQIDENDLKVWANLTDKLPVTVTESFMKDDTRSELATTVAVLQAELKGRDALIEQLRSDLDYARTPFWRRLLKP